MTTPSALRPAPPTPSSASAPTAARRRLRRVAKVLLVCLLGYLLLWGGSVVGMLGAHAWAARSESSGTKVAGINHFLPVDAKLLRGSAPGPDGYRALKDAGVSTVVDLRAEDMTAAELARPAEAGLDVVRLPIRDGQTPTEAQVERFLAIVRDAPGQVFVHCGAGVGRTGSITSAYLVRTGQASSGEALHRTLAVGPPSVEQVWYVLTTGDKDSDQPPMTVELVSRMLDAPRRMLSYL